MPELRDFFFSIDSYQRLSPDEKLIFDNWLHGYGLNTKTVVGIDFILSENRMVVEEVWVRHGLWPRPHGFGIGITGVQGHRALPQYTDHSITLNDLLYPLPSFLCKHTGHNLRWFVPTVTIPRNIPHNQRPQEVTFIMTDTAPTGAPAPFQVRDSDPPFTVTLILDDAAGEATTPDTIPVWSVSDPTAATLLSTNVDGTVATFQPGTAGTSGNITASTVDTNGTTVNSVGAFEVLPGEAVSGTLEFTAGTPAGGTPPAASATVPAAPAPSSDSGSASATPPADADTTTTTVGDTTTADASQAPAAAGAAPASA